MNNNNDNINNNNNPTSIVNDILQYPCDFPFKVIGFNNQDFIDLCLSVFNKHCANCFMADQIKYKTSKSNQYLSMTILVNAHSKAQLDAIYQELNYHIKNHATNKPLIKFVL